MDLKPGLGFSPREIANVCCSVSFYYIVSCTLCFTSTRNQIQSNTHIFAYSTTPTLYLKTTVPRSLQAWIQCHDLTEPQKEKM